MWLLNILALGISATAAYLMAKGRYRASFAVSLASQPVWFALGYQTGAWANCLFSCWMLYCNIQGLYNTRPRQNLTRGWTPRTWWEKFCWTFKIGWDACDNYGTYWNWKHRVTRHVDDKY